MRAGRRGGGKLRGRGTAGEGRGHTRLQRRPNRPPGQNGPQQATDLRAASRPHQVTTKVGPPSGPHMRGHTRLQRRPPPPTGPHMRGHTRLQRRPGRPPGQTSGATPGYSEGRKRPPGHIGICLGTPVYIYMYVLSLCLMSCQFQEPLRSGCVGSPLASWEFARLARARSPGSLRGAQPWQRVGSRGPYCPKRLQAAGRGGRSRRVASLAAHSHAHPWSSTSGRGVRRLPL